MIDKQYEYGLGLASPARADQLEQTVSASSIRRKHLLVELHGCCPKFLNDTKRVAEQLVLTTEQTGLRTLSVNIHRYQPQGVAGVVLFSRAHLSVHTWPEHCYAAADVFLGDAQEPRSILGALLQCFKASDTFCMEVQRGLPSPLWTLI